MENKNVEARKAKTVSCRKQKSAAVENKKNPIFSKILLRRPIYLFSSSQKLQQYIP